MPAIKRRINRVDYQVINTIKDICINPPCGITSESPGMGGSFTSRLRRAIRISIYIGTYLLAVRFITGPLHARGWIQSPLAALNALGYVIEFPGSAVSGIINHRATEGIDGIHWWISLGCNFVLYTAGLCIVSKFRIAHKSGLRTEDLGLSEEETRKTYAFSSPQSSVLSTQSYSSLSRRQFFRKGVDMAAGGGLGSAFGYALLVEPGSIRITRQRLMIHDLPAEMEGLRIIQISDVHHGPWLGLERVREVVRRTNALEPDLILLTGDYVYESPCYIEPAIAALAALKAKIGIVGVLGNHDWWDRGKPMKAAFTRQGLRLIDNTRVIVTRDRSIVREADNGLCLAGVGDLWEDIPNYRAALSNLPPNMPRLLLAHNPDCAEDPAFLDGHHRVDLMISGHTHGGQVWVPGIGTPIVPSRHGQKYASGLVQGPVCPVFISRGIGLSGLPIRFGVPPEIVLMELSKAG